MGLFRAVSEINGDFSRKYPTPVYFAPPLKRIPLEFNIGAQIKKETRMMRLTDGEKKFKIHLAV